MINKLTAAGLLSNGRYSTLITQAGTGYSRFDEIDLTRWSGDPVEDNDGFFIYLRDMEQCEFWSISSQPVSVNNQSGTFDASDGRVEIGQTYHGIKTNMAACVAPNANIEFRSLSLHNLSQEPRHIELTSYAEIVLNYHAADAAHPAFSKLFIQTEYEPEYSALLATRRPRSPDEKTVWAVHSLLAGNDEANSLTCSLQYETDRMRFIGRGRSTASPLALYQPGVLSNTTGSVLDPVFSLRCILELAPGETKRVVFMLSFAETRDDALGLIKDHYNLALVDEVFQSATRYADDELSKLDLSKEQAIYLQDLGSAILYADPRLRVAQDVLHRLSAPVARLSHYGLTGQRLLVVRVSGVGDQELVTFLNKAATYWSLKGARIELLLLSKGKQQNQLISDWMQNTGFAYVSLCLDEITEADLNLLLTAACCIIEDDLPVLPVNLDRDHCEAIYRRADTRLQKVVAHDTENLLFDNSYGGFSQSGNEYVIRLRPDELGDLIHTPLPWINVVSNEAMGFLISETGAGYTWSQNSRIHRLSPWFNDPVTDPASEAVYIRDEEAGVFWSPMPAPVSDGQPYEVHHGFGYSKFHHDSQSLLQETIQFVPRHDPLKIVRLQLTNRNDKARRLSIFSYTRLLLGDSLEQDTRFISTEYDAQSGAIIARNTASNDFSSSVTFLAAISSNQQSDIHYATNRSHFIGQHRSLKNPRALCEDVLLDEGIDDATNPCGVFQISVELPANSETVECVFLLGEVASLEQARTLIERYTNVQTVDDALHEVQQFWSDNLSTIRVKTPMPAVDIMVNGWLNYQNLSCRLWARSAFYQSGGAFGFRDQLQDAAALMYIKPELTRAQIVLHAAHQFVEGDVLHWWHPPINQGIRTHFSDDLLWLPYVTAYYVQAMGDTTLLDEKVSFLTARLLEEGEDEAYLAPVNSNESASVYEHCCRALDRSLTSGVNGLPLMGTGDWNDGMNRVGREGKGESVWMGFFLYHILENFMPICIERSDEARVNRYRVYQKELKENLNDTGWDGEWYRRAYYDDGTPLGSSESDECRIDAIAQAWSVISGVASEERQQKALDALDKYLISEDEGLIRLLWPAFDKTPHDPGYIKGYLPGVRENGGQYTHAAMWVVRAFAENGNGTRAAKLLEMLSPVSHADTAEQTSVYQVEPYVVAADVYGVDPHIGRGGWTWYTGSAGWMYRVALESVLGFRIEGGNTIVIKPCVPKEWGSFQISYTEPKTRTCYEIDISVQGSATVVSKATLDGLPVNIFDGAAKIPMLNDGASHSIVVRLDTTIDPAL